MNTIEAIKTADKVLNDQLAELETANKTGDIKAISNALRVGGLASMIVERGSIITQNPEKYEAAAKDSDPAIIPEIRKMTDVRAKAEGLLRFKSAYRAASQVRKVDMMLTRMSEGPKPRKARKSAHKVEVIH